MSLRFPKPAFLPEAFPSLDSYQERLRRRDAAFDWIVEQDFEFLVTIQFGMVLDEIRVATAVRRFGALMDRHWLGARWSQRPAEDRTYYIGAIEEGPKRGNTHVHLMLRRPRSVPRPADWRRLGQCWHLARLFTDRARQLNICPHGDIDFKEIRDGDDKEDATSYVLKDFHQGHDLILAV
jgi:hypothetical protein